MIRSRTFGSMTNLLTKEDGSTSLSQGNKTNSPAPPKKWRYFLAILIIGVFIYLWQTYSYRSIYREEHFKSDLAKEQVTIVMNTFKRVEMMESAVDHYSKCSVVKNIYIIWSEVSPPPERLVASYASRSHPQILFNVQSVDSLNNRFKPLPGSHSDAIFAVDDDMRISCSDLDLGYETWRNSQRNLVGYMPRIHLRQSDGSFVYRCWWRVWWHGVYSIILTKAAFLHHDYFEYYTNKMPSTIRELVDKKRNCEDIAMQFLVANVSMLPPVYVKGHLEDLGALNGISTSKSIVTAGHMDERSQCLNDLIDIYGRNPLVSSHLIVDSAKNGWTNAPSTWFEFISSDLWKF